MLGMILGGKYLKAEMLKMLMEGKKLQPSPGYIYIAEKMSILYLSQENESYLTVIVGNELVGKAMVVDLTIVELDDNSEHKQTHS